MSGRWLFALAAALTLISVAHGGESDESVQAAAAEARRNASSATGSAFELQVARALGVQKTRLVQQCLRQHRLKQDSGLRLLIRLDADGVAERVIADPGSAAGDCISAGLRSWRAVTPPMPEYWVEIVVQARSR
jgi:hypothetical protein